MSSANALSTPAQSRRRFHTRRRIDGLIYVDFGPDNGAILIDLGEGGLGFQSVVPVSLDQAVLLKFKVPGETNPVEGYAEVAWLNQSGKGGGLRFVELSADARARIRGFAGEQLPEPGALESFGAAEPLAAPEAAAEDSSANGRYASPAPQPDTDDALAQASQSFTAENTQPPSPILESIDAPPEALHAAPLAQNEVAQNEVAQDEVAHNEVAQNEAADSEFLASPSAAANALLAQFMVELAAAADAAEPLVTFDSAPPEAPAEEQSAPTEEQNAEVVAASEDSATALSGIAKATADLEPTASLRASSEIVAPPHSPAASELSAKSAAIPRTPLTPPIPREVPRHLVDSPARASRPQSPETRNADTRNSDARNLAQPPKRQRKPAPSRPEPAAHSKPDSSLPPAYTPDSTARGSFARQSAKPAFAGAEWDNVPGQEDEVKPQATLAAQALKVGIGAAAGACLILVLIFAVPSLRTAVQTTANARSGASTLANAPAFQVEVADLNNRRWILRSGGDAGSPFGDTPSRRDAPAAASNSSRKESAKSSRSDESDDSAETVAAPQPKLANPAQLTLSRPVAKPADAPAAQLLAPSIFDGITPPIGSLTDRLPGSGPDLPGVVQPANPAAGRSALQSAVLLQRVAPVYPSEALGARVQGEISVNATIGTDGIPKDLKLIKGDQRLVAAAFTAIRQSRYRPATLGGMPIETQTTITVSFELK